jgi:hypothetical protein
MSVIALAPASIIISIFIREESGITSVGLNATPFVNDTYR